MCYPQASPWARVVEHVGDAGPAQFHLEHNPLALLRACHTTPIRKLNDPAYGQQPLVARTTPVYNRVTLLAESKRPIEGCPMQFGIFYEHQLPRPWTDGAEQQLFQEALEQVELADRLGLDYAWEVEHHFLEEYSHSSAPEVFLAAASQRTRRIRLGHGIVIAPPRYNHPARVAERIAMLDLVSGGRVEFGTGESASRIALEAFGVQPADKR